jgi:hypothetical protein
LLGPDVIGVALDAHVHPIVNVAEPIHLLWICQLFLLRSARRSKRVMQAKFVAVVQVNFVDRRLGEQIENIRTGSTKADDRGSICQ